jgi:hypothetical protein
MKFGLPENHGRIRFFEIYLCDLFSNRFDLNLPELGSVTLGITDIRKELIQNQEEDIPMEIIHRYDFNCSCNKCHFAGEIDRTSSENINFE